MHQFQSHCVAKQYRASSQYCIHGGQRASRNDKRSL
jgi:hypothetical protein